MQGTGKLFITALAGGGGVEAIDKAPFQAAVKPVYDQFVTDPHLKDLLARMQATN